MAKRISKSAIDWAKLDKLVPTDQKPNLMAFKAKSYAYLRRVQANPEEPPAIDWESYKKTVPVDGMVDKFQTEYKNFKVPYPEDKYSSEVDTQWASLETEIQKFCEEMKANIAAANNELKRIDKLPRFDEMTMEMFADMYPKDAIDPVNNPTFWPHDPEEQLGYKDPTAKAEH